MSASTKSYPFPVLGNLDDIAGQFNPTLRYSLEPNKVVVESDFNLENSTIENLVSQKSATYLVQVECGSTFYRNVFVTSDNKIRIEIDAQDLRDKVDVSFAVVATKDIPNYDPEGIHPDLAGEPSYVEKGDVLADGGTGWFTADKTFDPLKAPVSSFMKIQEGTKKTGPMEIDYGDDHILIKLAKNDFENYKFTRKYATSVLHSSLVLPALIDVLYTMNNKQSDYSDQPWFSRIQQICRERSINLDEPLMAAQQLLGQPIDRSLSQVQQIMDSEE
jgi:hypothetical protein